MSEVVATESWRPIAGYEGFYEVSNMGGVRSVERTISRAKGGDAKYPSRTMSQAIVYGYSAVTLSRDGSPRRFLVHRLVLFSFVGKPQEGQEACHNDGNRANNKLENLRWDTHLNNMRDKAEHGTEWQLRKTHCPKGHPYAGDNLVLEKNGHRRCRLCKNAVNRDRYRRNTINTRRNT